MSTATASKPPVRGVGVLEHEDMVPDLLDPLEIVEVRGPIVAEYVLDVVDVEVYRDGDRGLTF